MAKRRKKKARVVGFKLTNFKLVEVKRSPQTIALWITAEKKQQPRKKRANPNVPENQANPE